MKRKILSSFGILWALPMSIIGLLIVLVYRWHRWRYQFPYVEVIVKRTIPKWAMGQTFGFVIVYSGPIYKERFKSLSWAAVDRERRIVRHERRHVLQSMIFGPLFPIMYGFGLVYAVVRRRNWYKDNPFEIDARSVEEKKRSSVV
jgi:cytochrome c-type biogenesis protein CcmH/NrfF